MAGGRKLLSVVVPLLNERDKMRNWIEGFR